MITGTQISTRVGVLLNDVSKIRWPDTERLDWINECRRQVAVRDTGIFGGATEIVHSLTAGCRQRITTPNAYMIVSIDSNLASGKAISETSRAVLDAFKPSWRNDTDTDVKHWFHDKTDPLAFWVYPGATGSVKGYALVMPSDITALTEDALPNDKYEAAMVNYVCYRALSKEDEAAAATKAAAFYQLFISAFA